MAGKGETGYGCCYFPSYNIAIDNGQLFGYIQGNSAANYNALVGTTVSIKTWNHAELVKKGSTIYLYLNGVLNTSAAVVGTPNTDTSDPFYIGTGNNRGALNEFFPGQIDQVRVFNYGRTASQVAWDYNRGAPVAWYKFDECQGTVAHDSSVNRNDGTITIGASGSQTAAGTCTDGNSAHAWNNGVVGKINNSLNFDGTDDYVTMGKNVLNTTGNFTVSAWVKLSVLNNYQAIVSEIGTDNAAGEYQMRVSSSNTIQLIRRFGGSTSTYLVASSLSNTLTTNKWYLITGVYSGSDSNLRIYINGVIDPNTASSSSYGASASSQTIIGSADANAYPFAGQIDDVRLYNYALTQNQILNLYNGGASVRFAPLTGAP
jgi:hypothetical protein